MPFRWWHYACKVVVPAGFLAVFSGMLLRHDFGTILAAVGLVVMLVLGIVGAALGLRMASGNLRMLCPVCGQSGEMWGNKREGMRMNCPSCGVIASEGLRLVRHGPLRAVAGDPATKLEDRPVAERPILPLFPAGLVYFRQWRYLRWFFCMVVPLIVSSALAWSRHRLDAAMAVMIFGGVCAVIVFVELSSGMVSSNHGTYFRSREPARYWASVTIFGSIYLFACVAGWLINGFRAG